MFRVDYEMLRANIECDIDKSKMFIDYAQKVIDVVNQFDGKVYNVKFEKSLSALDSDKMTFHSNIRDLSFEIECYFCQYKWCRQVKNNTTKAINGITRSLYMCNFVKLDQDKRIHADEITDRIKALVKQEQEEIQEKQDKVNNCEKLICNYEKCLDELEKAQKETGVIRYYLDDINRCHHLCFW